MAQPNDGSTCKARVTPAIPWGSFHQHGCSRKAWKDGYCHQHHPDTVKARQIITETHYAQRRAESPWNKLRLAHERIIELETELANLKEQLV